MVGIDIDIIDIEAGQLKGSKVKMVSYLQQTLLLRYYWDNKKVPLHPVLYLL